MPVKFIRRYTREKIRHNPEVLYVFGDNVARYGLGGQAAEARGEPNAVGIPTKWKPARNKGDYLRDSDFERWLEIAWPDFKRIADHLAKGGIVIIPADGIGTGLAELPNRAPRIYEYICRFIAGAQKHYG